MLFNASLLLLLAATSCFTSAQSGCPQGIFERKEVRDMTDAEWSAYSGAVKQMQSGASPTPYDRFVKIHIDNKLIAHGFPLFGPWHRYYIREFEKELQKINPAARLPYWNWASDSQAPEASAVLSAKYFGTNGKGSSMCVTDGAFANWKPAYPSPHCYSRNYDGGSHISSFYGIEVINQAITSNKDYDSFRQAIEYAPHGAVHNNIGGEMPAMHSVNDPIFWSHHAYIDKIYSDWQRANPSAANTFNGRNQDGSAASPDTPMAPFNAHVRDVFDIRTLCYTYREMGGGAPTTSPPPVAAPPTSAPPTSAPPTSAPTAPPTTAPPTSAPPTTPPSTPPTAPKAPTQTQTQSRPSPAPAPTTGRHSTHPPPPPSWGRNWWSSRNHRLVRRVNSDSDDDDNTPGTITPQPEVPADDRENLVLLRRPAPIPMEWCEMNGLQVHEVRAQEEVYAHTVNQVNSIDDYVSPAALWLRNDLTARLVSEKRVTKFVATVRGKHAEISVEEFQSSSNITEVVHNIKDKVRAKCGGAVRGKVKKYSSHLQQYVGPVIETSGASDYLLTKPKKYTGPIESEPKKADDNPPAVSSPAPASAPASAPAPAPAPTSSAVSGGQKMAQSADQTAPPPDNVTNTGSDTATIGDSRAEAPQNKGGDEPPRPRRKW